ncbi:Phosphoserine phosphatase SerB1 [Mycobacterium simulans]|uniref:HAD family hydrolase n=1 Tax=Mycobacterium simulans TaxID=627089 RepID=UPI00174DDCF4|nr:HAD-IB family hydrolase [Mycobacterium simulans]SON63081.1 Phosphoserine phosphatase SerB1 [Mycobacterium simulans]
MTRQLDGGGVDLIEAINAGARGPRVGAFFDLDGTLVDGFTAMAHVGDRVRRRQAGIGEMLRVADAALRYRFGRVQFEHVLTRAAGYLRGESIAELNKLGHQLFVDRLASRVYSIMGEIVQAHQRQGHTVVLASSALSIHALPVARFLGMADVLCNHFDLDEHGRLTGGIVKPIVWGANKARAVRQFCAANDVVLQDSYCYADGEEDLALMSLVGFPRPVNPRRELATVATAHGWPVLFPKSTRVGPAGILHHLAGYSR